METVLLFSRPSLLIFSSFSSPGKSLLNNLMADRVCVDMLGSNNSSTSSRLVPVSRDPTAQLTTQLRHRETPAEYRPASTNQSHGTLEQQRTTELGDEMRAVQSIYTACIRDQDLSSTVQDLYRLVTTLAAEAVPESDAYLDSSIEKANIVRTIDRFVRETTSDYSTALRELSSRTHDTRLFRFHAHLGDYAGGLCDTLKESGSSTSSILSGPWTLIVKTIDDYQDSVASWKARGCKDSEPSCPVMDALEVRVQEIIDSGLTDLDIDLALFAIRSYARRNSIAHGEIFDLYQSKQFAGLADYIDNDEKLLEGLLPDEEKPMLDNWRRLLRFHRSKRIRQTGDGDWKAKSPLRVTPVSSLLPAGRLGRVVLRSQIEMGKRRESNSPDGPPPTNVKFDTSLFRRRSEPGKRSISKRSAVEQPPGEPPLKKARGPFYSPSLEAITENIEDSDALGAEELQLELHTLAAQLAQAKPGKATMVFKRQIEELGLQLEKTRTGIAKLKRQKDRRGKKYKPKGSKA